MLLAIDGGVMLVMSLIIGGLAVLDIRRCMQRTR